MNIHDYAEEKKLSLKKVIDFTSCVNPLGPSMKAKHLVRQHIRDAHLFADPEARYLTRLICKKEMIGQENLLLGSGSTDLLQTIFQTMKSRKVLVPSPIPFRLQEMSARYDLDIRGLISADDAFSINTANLVREMADVDVLLIPYPHNMVGTSLPVEEIETILNAAADVGTTVILDESYRDFTNLRSPVEAVIRSGHAVILRTFSLFHALAAMPTGYILASAPIIEEIRRKMPAGRVNTLAALAAAASLKDKEYGKRTLRYIAEEKKFFLKAFAEMEDLFSIDTPCPFFIIRIDGDLQAFRKLFSRYDIFINEFFEEKGGYYLKVPVRRHKWNARFLKTLRNALGGVTLQ